ncbi:hypothetical protein BaRGS_00020081 [Batillaria attramentaria]|uniref:Uncharacterized protein n=1 Tax=Batillaria attramentaria TaxID=370345 RepID=A0ABD0KNL3_9CAEN
MEDICAPDYRHQGTVSHRSHTESSPIRLAQNNMESILQGEKGYVYPLYTRPTPSGGSPPDANNTYCVESHLIGRWAGRLRLSIDCCCVLNSQELMYASRQQRGAYAVLQFKVSFV